MGVQRGRQAGADVDELPDTSARHETPTTNSVVLSGLVPGWTYNIQVWANGGPSTPLNATIKVTV